MADKLKVEGEGSYSATKDYNERTRKFIDSGKVKDAARKAQPKNEEEKHAMQKAERIGREHAKEEDPALRNPSTPGSTRRPSTIGDKRRSRWTPRITVATSL